MSTPILLKLQEKIQAAAITIDALKKERDRLEAQVGMMREESLRSRKIISAHRRLLSERDRMRMRMESLLKKLSTLKV
jgi:FtsZ-binding cell division protein ZapB